MSGRPLNQYVVEGLVYWRLEASHLNRIESWRSRVQAAGAKKAEAASDDTRRTPRPCTISDRQKGLHPLDIGEVGVGDGADAFSEQVVKFLYSTMSTARSDSQRVHKFGCTERRFKPD